MGKGNNYKLYCDNKVLLETKDEQDFREYLEDSIIGELADWIKDTGGNDDKDDIERVLRSTISALKSKDIKEMVEDLNSYYCGYGATITMEL